MLGESGKKEQEVDLNHCHALKGCRELTWAFPLNSTIALGTSTMIPDLLREGKKLARGHTARMASSLNLCGLLVLEVGEAERCVNGKCR